MSDKLTEAEVKRIRAAIDRARRFGEGYRAVVGGEEGERVFREKEAYAARLEGWLEWNAKTFNDQPALQSAEKQ